MFVLARTLTRYDHGGLPGMAGTAGVALRGASAIHNRTSAILQAAEAASRFQPNLCWAWKPTQLPIEVAGSGRQFGGLPPGFPSG